MTQEMEQPKEDVIPDDDIDLEKNDEIISEIIIPDDINTDSDGPFPCPAEIDPAEWDTWKMRNQRSYYRVRKDIKKLLGESNG